MCETIDLMVFQAKTPISTEKQSVTAVTSVDIGMSGEKIPKYPPTVVIVEVIADENPVESGKCETMPLMSRKPRLIMAFNIMKVCEYRVYELPCNR